MLKPYKDPIAWQRATLPERLEALVRHYCTGPCGQDQTTGEIRSSTSNTLREAIARLAAVEAERDRMRGVAGQCIELASDPVEDNSVKIAGLLKAALAAPAADAGEVKP